VITGWRGEGKSKQQINEDNTNKDQVVVEMEEWSGKEKMMKQKGKLREKKETEKIFIDKDFTKQEREDTEETKNHRERRKKGRELSKSGI
jgi:hypothetical protein